MEDQKDNKIVCSDVTSALIRATEYADNVEDVMILTFGPNGDRTFASPGVTRERALWLLERYKSRIVGGYDWSRD
jgi:hypothetical protein